MRDERPGDISVEEVVCAAGLGAGANPNARRR